MKVADVLHRTLVGGLALGTLYLGAVTLHGYTTFFMNKKELLQAKRERDEAERAERLRKFNEVTGANAVDTTASTAK
jgi:hypothetical protein